jgi:F420-0:gamma-glutamyl ligase
MPLRRGTTGIYLAHSGFKALNDYIGKTDLFGRTYAVSKASVASGLAASAVVTMGEGTEQTPLCLITDVPFVQFQDRNPDQEELSELTISMADDVFSQFLTAIEWRSDKN